MRQFDGILKKLNVRKYSSHLSNAKETIFRMLISYS